MAQDGRVLEAFKHDRKASWTCIAPVTIEHPAGRIQVAPGTTFTAGTSYMGVDLAAWLDEQRWG